MVHPTPTAQPLDDYLREVVQTLRAAVTQGLRHVEDDPRAAGQRISDCEEILAEIMAGNVQEWIAVSSP